MTTQTLESKSGDFIAQLNAGAARIEAQFAENQAAASDTSRNAGVWLEEPDEPDTPLIERFIDCGEFVAIVGQSKAGKSFFALQAAVCVATGRDFIGRQCVRKRVYYANLEVSSKQCKKRLRGMCTALEVSSGELRDWLFVDNLKCADATWEYALAVCKAHGCEVAIIDPFYKIAEVDEKDQRECLEAVKRMREFTKAGITLFVVFHSPKGFSGDRQLIDMISGSATLARDPESIIGLLNHATEKNVRIVETILRNYTLDEPSVVSLENGAFRLAPDISPEVATSRNAALRSRTPEAKATEGKLQKERLKKTVEEYFETNPALSVEAFYSALREYPAARAYGQNLLKVEIKALIHHGILKRTDALERKPDGTIGRPKIRFSIIGTPTRIQEYVDGFPHTGE